MTEAVVMLAACTYMRAGRKQEASLSTMHHSSKLDQTGMASIYIYIIYDIALLELVYMEH